jgi:hypothetical protein
MRFLAVARTLLLCVAIGLWFTVRSGVGGAAPRALAILAGLIVLVSALHGALSLAALRRRERVMTLLASAAVSAGVVLVGAGGLANWLRGIQGYVLLTEKEARPLSGGGHSATLEFGPLASTSELELFLTLEKLELEPVPPAGFRAVARVRVTRPGEAEREVTFDASTPALVGPLRLHVGAFGFVPRIVVLKDGRMIFDRSVPFRTSPDSGGLRFEESITLEEHKLALRGVISLEGLDERMKGHPRLSLSAVEDGKPIGEGVLDPGHFAAISNGYRLGFAGTRRWAEVDVTRRSYPLPIRAGLALAVLGAITWPIAAWRRW